MPSKSWITAATRVRGDLAKMLAMCELICLSSQVTPKQMEAAKTARASLPSAVIDPTDMRIQVASTLFEKLIAKL